MDVDGLLTEEQVERIMRRVGELGLDLTGLGGTIGMDKGQIWRVMHRRNIPRLDTLQRLANGLDWTLAQLLATTEDKQLANSIDELYARVSEMGELLAENVQHVLAAQSGELEQRELETAVLRDAGAAVIADRQRRVTAAQSRARRGSGESDESESPSRGRRIRKSP